MDLVQLETFLKISERGSFTVAAEQLYVSQATVSARVKALEAQLGVSLFERNSHHVTPTSAGVQLVTYAREILSMADDARSAVRSRDIKPFVRLGCSPSSSSYIMPALLRRFAEVNPDISILVEVDAVPALMEKVGKEGLDLALVEPCGAHENVSVTPLAPDPVVIAIGANTPFARIENPAPASMVAALPFVMRCKQCCTLRFTSATLGKALNRSSFELNVSMWVDELEMLKKLVLDGTGVTAISHVAMLAEFLTGDFLSLEVEGVQLVRQRSLAMPSSAATNEAVEIVRDFLMSDETLDLLASPDSLLTCPMPEELEEFARIAAYTTIAQSTVAPTV